MLSVPTLWLVFMVNFLALGMIWTYVATSYPKFVAARFWMAAAYLASAGAGLSIFRGPDESYASAVPLIFGGSLMIICASCSTMGVLRFYNRPTRWREFSALAAACFASLSFFFFVHDNMPVRILIFSLGLTIPFLLPLPLLLGRGGRGNPGARLAGLLSALIISVNVVRSVAALLNMGGDLMVITFNPLQAVTILILVFLSMAWNFGLVLMAIDRLRSEVADLALSDELTGAANRRALLQRLPEECTQARRTGRPFSLLAIDLDGFKAINDGYGHATGDECLQRFVAVVRSQLRPDDLLARTGGDEFCVVLPGTTLQDGSMIARRIVEACGSLLTPENGVPYHVGASIGVAQWTPQIGAQADRLIAAADQALYAAKHEGKNRYAVYDPPAAAEPITLRRTA